MNIIIYRKNVFQSISLWTHSVQNTENKHLLHQLWNNTILTKLTYVHIIISYQNSVYIIMCAVDLGRELWNGLYQNLPDLRLGLSKIFNHLPSGILASIGSALDGSDQAILHTIKLINTNTLGKMQKNNV